MGNLLVLNAKEMLQEMVEVCLFLNWTSYIESIMSHPSCLWIRSARNLQSKSLCSFHYNFRLHHNKSRHKMVKEQMQLRDPRTRALLWWMFILLKTSFEYIYSQCCYNEPGAIQVSPRHFHIQQLSAALIPFQINLDLLLFSPPCHYLLLLS